MRPSGSASRSLVDDIAAEHAPVWDAVLRALVCRSCGYACICYAAAVAVIDSRETPGRRTEAAGQTLTPGARLWRGRAPT